MDRNYVVDRAQIKVKAAPPSPDGGSVFAEDDLLPISALRHLLFCPRQCALIHVEQLWVENRLRIEGRHLHERADGGRGETRRRRRGQAGGGDGDTGAAGVRIARALPLRSLVWGVGGKADVVEFRPGTPTGRRPRTWASRWRRCRGGPTGCRSTRSPGWSGKPRRRISASSTPSSPRPESRRRRSGSRPATAARRWTT